MRRWTVAHCVFAEIRPRLGDFRAFESLWKIPFFGTLAVVFGAYSLLRGVSRGGCSGGLPRITYLRKCALDAVIHASLLKSLTFHSNRRERYVYLVLRDVIRARCSDGLLCIAHLRNVHSTRRFSCLALEEPYFGTLTVEPGAYLVLGDTSRAGCSVGMPRIAHYRNWTLDAAISMPHFGRALLWCAHRR